MSRILVPVDGTAESKIALEKAFERFPAGDVFALHVVEASNLPKDGDGSDTELSIEDADEVKAGVEKIAVTYDRNIEFDTAKGHAVRAIVSYAEENEIDRIVMKSSETSTVERALLGGVAESVKEKAPCPVTIVS